MIFREPVSVNDPAVRRLLDAIGSRKRKACVTVSETCVINGTYWDGGSRTEWTAVRLSDGMSQGAPHFNPPQFGGPLTAPIVAVPPGIVIVQHGTFCGKPATPCFHVNPADLAHLLPQGAKAPALPA